MPGAVIKKGRNTPTGTQHLSERRPWLRGYKYTQIEDEMSYDFERKFNTGNATTGFFRSGFRILDGLLGVKFQPAGAIRPFFTVKGGFVNFSGTNPAAAAGPLSCQKQTIQKPRPQRIKQARNSAMDKIVVSVCTDPRLSATRGKLLQAAGFDVQECTSVCQACEAVGRSSPAIVLLCHTVPEPARSRLAHAARGLGHCVVENCCMFQDRLKDSIAMPAQLRRELFEKCRRTTNGVIAEDFSASTTACTTEAMSPPDALSLQWGRGTAFDQGLGVAGTAAAPKVTRRNKQTRCRAKIAH